MLRKQPSFYLNAGLTIQEHLYHHCPLVLLPFPSGLKLGQQLQLSSGTAMGDKSPFKAPSSFIP